MDEYMNVDHPKVLFLTPEKIDMSNTTVNFLLNLYKNNKLARIVVDEAHCISNWGRDFRPAYLNLGKVKELFPDVPTMALTATATEKVKIDIVDKLKMRNCLYF